MKDFLGHYIEEKNGDVLDVKGTKIGSHNGSFFFTMGERHGFTIDKKGTADTPLFVVAKDVEKNTITVAPRKDFMKVQPQKKGKVVSLEAGFTSEVNLINTNWIPSSYPPFGKYFEARIHHRGERYNCNFMQVRDDTALLVFDMPVWGVSAGQSLVVYDGEECIGGGIIFHAP